MELFGEGMVALGKCGSGWLLGWALVSLNMLPVPLLCGDKSGDSS